MYHSLEISRLAFHSMVYLEPEWRTMWSPTRPQASGTNGIGSSSIGQQHRRRRQQQAAAVVVLLGPGPGRRMPAKGTAVCEVMGFAECSSLTSSVVSEGFMFDQRDWAWGWNISELEVSLSE